MAMNKKNRKSALWEKKCHKSQWHYNTLQELERKKWNNKMRRMTDSVLSFTWNSLILLSRGDQ